MYSTFNNGCMLNVTLCSDYFNRVLGEVEWDKKTHTALSHLQQTESLIPSTALRLKLKEEPMDRSKKYS